MAQRWLKRRLTLTEQFSLISLGILLSGMLIIGWWVSSRIESAAINQTANVTALYMDSFVAPLIQDILQTNAIDPTHQQQFDHLLVNSQLSQEIVSIKIWSPSGEILYSKIPGLKGLRFTDDPDLHESLRGNVVSRLSPLNKPENAFERVHWSTLIETYAPVREEGTGRVIAVAEFYQNAAPLVAQIASAQQQSWLVVMMATLAMYGLLYGVVRSANRTIERQKTQLQQSVDRLTALLAENQHLHHRVQTAATRATEINEQFLRRIGRDLHDGPAQDLALALMQIDDLNQARTTQTDTIRHALESALHEIRTLASGLQLPELEALDTAQVGRRAVREFQHKSGVSVEFEVDPKLPALSPPKKVAIYRVIVEALHNANRHAGAKDIHGRLWAENGAVCLEVSDNGPGFDPTTINADGEHLGIAGLEQRVTLLNGTFEIRPNEPTGTRVSVRLPVEGD